MLVEDLCYRFLKVTELAAFEAYQFAGRADEKGADKAAVNAVRSALNAMDIDGRVVIGEGERDKAPMLYCGEKVGKGGISLDIAVDPLEGTTTCASYKDGAMSVIAVAERDSLLQAPDVYMDKIAVGPGLPLGVISLQNDLKTNMGNLADARECDVSDLVAVVLKRERHDSLIGELRALGARIRLIDDGDIGAVISMIRGESDICLGIGGAPEGVLSAVALAAVGGQIYGKLVLNTPELRSRAAECGIEDCDKSYSVADMVRGDAFFVATGITDSTLLGGIRFDDNSWETDSIIFAPGGAVMQVRHAHQL
ncbi:fructose-1,6-bisphosphatase class 2 [Anaplasma platys]|uniref:Fructose-1,6-bisphosphatase n=1 Tax=Anaplasma platys TaxID=949 RepID=A0A858PXK4_9RICK|nr:class II fructose-bisphosphatase [Anaplasma platys]QJC27310.1 fructose-1,6-bisphosphatase class 2 [Anaplasma platys]